MKRVALSALCLIGTCLAANATDLPEPPEILEERATDVVLGQITDVEVREEPAAESGYTDLACYYTLEVATVESGDAIHPGDVVVVRAYEFKEIGGRMCAGHRPLPAVGARVRAYLNGRRVVFPNGFMPPLSQEETPQEEVIEAMSALHQPGFLEGLRVNVESDKKLVPDTAWFPLAILGLIAFIAVAGGAAYRLTKRCT